MTAPRGLRMWNPSTRQSKVLCDVARIFEVDPVDLAGRSRARPLVEYRHIAMWVIRRCFPLLSLAQIGSMFGNRDHSTVIQGIGNIDWRRECDAELRALTDTIVEAMGGILHGLAFDRETAARKFAVAEKTWLKALAAYHPARAGPAPPPIPVRQVKPKNRLDPDDSDAVKRAQGTAVLGAAIERFMAERAG